MSDFDDIFALEAQAAASEMGEDVEITVSGSTVTVPGVVGPLDYTTSLSMSLGGVREKPEFTVHLTREDAIRSRAAKGVRLKTARGIEARVISTQDMGGGGLMLNCGPVATRDV